MTIGTTNLQDERQNQQAATGVEAAIPYRIDTQPTIPTFYQTNHAAEWLKNNPQITPPSESEIHGKMWESSMMMGLMVALATGNVSGGLAGGMWAACAVHDHGYALRERSEYIDQLKGDGYSFPSILKWYESGDQGELDKERAEMEKKREFDESRQDQRDQFRETQDEKVREFNAGQELSREQMANQRNIAGMQIAAADRRAREAADRADSAAMKSGFTQMNMQHRQALMNAAKNDSEQFRAMQKSQAAADKAVADAKLGSPIALQQLLLMGQLIDAPNASVKLTQLHHMSEGAAHGMIDSAMQTANRLVTGEPVTNGQMQDLLQVIAVGHQAQTDTYFKQVGRQAQRYKDDFLEAQSNAEKDPGSAEAAQQLQMKKQDYEDFSSAAGLNPQEMDYAVRLYAASPKVMDENHDKQPQQNNSDGGKQDKPTQQDLDKKYGI